MFGRLRAACALGRGLQLALPARDEREDRARVGEHAEAGLLPGMEPGELDATVGHSRDRCAEQLDPGVLGGQAGHPGLGEDLQPHTPPAC